MKKLYFTVTNGLTFDQRMHRICSSLAAHGYEVTLVGRVTKNKIPEGKPFHQKRLKCFFNKGFLFYAEFNIRLFFFLLFSRIDGICAIDLDTILPCLLVSKIKKIPRIYDAHELFTEMKEVRNNAFVYKFWLQVERFTVPRFPVGYTVSNGLAMEFERRYRSEYAVIRNITVLQEEQNLTPSQETFLLYQGAVNEGRGFEQLIPAMKNIDYKLVVCGDGNFMPQLKKLIIENNVQDKIELKGMLPPSTLREITQKATLGINLVEKEGLNQYYSLPNKFFDYIHAGLPQLTMNYPEYRTINEEFEVAVLLEELSMEAISTTINSIMSDAEKFEKLKRNCLSARTVYNWQNEERKLVQIYHTIFRGTAS